jgi:hypothetical protein
MAEKCDDPTKNDDLKGTIEIELQDLPIQDADLEIAGFKWLVYLDMLVKNGMLCASTRIDFEFSYL